MHTYLQVRFHARNAEDLGPFNCRHVRELARRDRCLCPAVARSALPVPILGGDRGAGWDVGVKSADEALVHGRDLLDGREAAVHPALRLAQVLILLQCASERVLGRRGACFAPWRRAAAHGILGHPSLGVSRVNGGLRWWKFKVKSGKQGEHGCRCLALPEA